MKESFNVMESQVSLQQHWTTPIRTNDTETDNDDNDSLSLGNDDVEEEFGTPTMTKQNQQHDQQHNQHNQEHNLEHRIDELEWKLATLSRLIQQSSQSSQSQSQSVQRTTTNNGHTTNNNSTTTTTTTPIMMVARPTTPPPPPAAPSSPPPLLLERTDTTPYLESPCPSRRNSESNMLLLTQSQTQSQTEDDEQEDRIKGTTTIVDKETTTTTPISMDIDIGNDHHYGTLSSLSETKGNYGTLVPSSSNLLLRRRKHHPNVMLGQQQQQRPQQQRQQQQQQKSIQQKWMDYLNTFQESHYDVDVQMQEFINVPVQLEYVLCYGLWISVDCYLYVLTILPIRFVWSCLLLLSYGRQWLLYTVLRTSCTNHRRETKFHRRHLYQLIQVGIIVSVTYCLLMPISIGKLYHWIRGQAMLKLYVLIAIVEVFDRLMSSLGQDCLDSMYWNTTRNPRSTRMVVSVVVVLDYAGVHTLILFVHVATLNVAMNSADSALLALLISGNFAEIKSTVFKKYNRPNLFKITASDVCERFKLVLFLGLVLVLNKSQGMTLAQGMNYIQMCTVVWVAEMLSDWIKHSFITKFNFLPSQVYAEYALVLAGDVTGFGHEGVNLDHSHAVVKRIGLAQVPLVCVLARYLIEAARYSPWSRDTLAVIVVVVWSVLLLLKYALGRRLQAVSYVKLQNAPELKCPPASSIKKKEGMK